MTVLGALRQFSKIFMVEQCGTVLSVIFEKIYLYFLNES